MWEIRPILTVLWRNRLGAGLVIVQIALTLAIISNAIFVVAQRQAFIARETGMAVDEIFSFTMQPATTDANMENLIAEDLHLMRNMSAITAVTPINSIPLSGGGWGESFSTKPNDQLSEMSSNLILVDEEGIRALGIKLVAGRDFRAEEIKVQAVVENLRPDVIIITQQLADKLFPEGNALNQNIYINGDQPVKVIGIAERCLGNWVSWSDAGSVAFIPQILLDTLQQYLVRTTADQRDTVMRQVESALAKANPTRVFRRFRTLESYKNKSYIKDSAMVKILTLTSTVLAIITTLGIIGLTVFWVHQRRRQIGTRRALGASKLAIMRYFLLENAMLSGVGILLGGFLALVCNSLLVQYQGQQPLTISYLLTSAIALVLLGLLAVFWPALRAANTAPALATRSV